MKAQHTAGPWKTDSDGTISNEQKAVAITANHGHLTTRHFATEEDKANAALITAAPDMLETLQNIVDASAVGDNLDFAEILAVIAKAKGE